MSILIVDDSEDTVILLEKILKNAGYEDIISAKSAKEAYDLLKINSHLPGIIDLNLILMDIVMPGTDGIEACHEIKSNDNYQYVPVIMLTAVTDVSDLQRAFSAGATDYITKPFNKIELLTRVRSMLKLKDEMDRRISRENELVQIKEQLETSNKMLKQLSYLDALTGVANRRYFDNFIGKEWKRAVREKSSLAIIFIDIDYFKTFNDTYGHQTGDFCLKQIAKAIGEAVKRPGDIVARYGGEEFVVVLPGTDKPGAFKVAEEIRLNVLALKIEHSASRVLNIISISLGVASSTPVIDTIPAVLIKKADEALYKAKENGRNRVEFESE